MALNTLNKLTIHHRYAGLGCAFSSKVFANFPRDARLVCASDAVSELLGLPPQCAYSPEFIQAFTQCSAPFADAIAQVYGGHQFGHWVHQLGDGRAALLGEIETANGEYWDVQLKGSGVTPYSRGGDGRAVLRSSIREFLASEAMHGLGIPTTRAWALFASHQKVQREIPEPCAMVVRVAQSHIRFGTFEYFYHKQKYTELNTLIQFTLDTCYPHLKTASHPIHALACEVVQRTARTIAKWQAVGFCHGVMNTDNMSILGLTLDYGPFGFMDAFHPKHICNTSDTTGRYAFDEQANVGYWNCMAWLSTLLKQLSEAQAQEALSLYTPAFESHYRALLMGKLGLTDTGQTQADDDLISAWFGALVGQDYTCSFRALCDVSKNTQALLPQLLTHHAPMQAWLKRYQARLQQEQTSDAKRQAQMRAVNPIYVLRNHLAQTAIAKSEAGDDSEVSRLLTAVSAPFEEKPEFAEYAQPAPDWASQIRVSCSA